MIDCSQQLRTLPTWQCDHPRVEMVLVLLPSNAHTGFCLCVYALSPKD